MQHPSAAYPALTGRSQSAPDGSTDGQALGPASSLCGPIVLFTNSWAMGGLEQHIVQLARGLSGRGAAVAVICTDVPALEPMRRDLRAAGITVLCPAVRQAGPLGAVRRFRALVRLLRPYAGGLLHLHLGGFDGADLVLLAAQLAGVRTVVRTEHMPPAEPISGRTRRWVQWRDRWLHRVICVSEQTRQAHLSALGRDPDKCVVVPNCIDLTTFSPTTRGDGVAAEFGFAPGQPIVGTVSRLAEERKGLHFFLEMAARVARVEPEARFLIVGDGPLRPALERSAHDLGLDGRIAFAGARSDVPRLLAALRIFVMPSLAEGGPYTVLEALALEKAVVATPVGIVPDVIRPDRSGILVPPADSNALADGVVRLLRDDDLAQRFGRTGRAIVERRYSLDAMTDGVLAIYQEALGRRLTG